jgi:hypothetical protein
MKRKTTFKTLTVRAALLLLAMLTATNAWATITGSGTASDPYRINSSEDWNSFCDSLTESNDFFAGKFVNLGADITVTRMAHRFKGTFNGLGHTLTVNLNNDQVVTAPFRYVSDATIKYLVTAGTISISDKFASGIVGKTEGGAVSITHCVSNVTISSSVGGDGTHGGIVGLAQYGTVNITDCAFIGQMLGESTTLCGGFVGYTANDVTTTITNGLFAPTNIEIHSGCTFSRAANMNSVTITNCYYTEPLGTSQGTDASGMSNEALAAALGDQWHVDNGMVLPWGFEVYDISQCDVSGLLSIYFEGDESLVPVPVVTAPDGTVLNNQQDYALSVKFPDGTAWNLEKPWDVFIAANTAANPTNPEPFTSMAYNSELAHFGPLRTDTLTITGIPPHCYGSQSFVYRAFRLKYWSDNDWYDGYNTVFSWRITDPNELIWLAEAVNNGQNLIAYWIGFSDLNPCKFTIDADLAYDPDSLTFDLDGDGTPESNFIPIGTAEHPFISLIKGGIHRYGDSGSTVTVRTPHVVSGIRCHSNDSCVGFFGNLTGTADNIAIEDAVFTGPATVGGIAGKCSGTISNSVIAGSTVTSTGGGNCGTIVGQNDGSTFSNNYYSYCTVGGVANATNAATPDGDSEGIQIGIPVTCPETTTLCIDEESTVGVFFSNRRLYGGAGEALKININDSTDINDVYTVVGGTLTFDGDYHLEHELEPKDNYGVVYCYGYVLHGGKNPVFPYTLAIPAGATQGDSVSISPNNLWGTLDGCDGTEAHPYVIRTPADIELLADVVNKVKFDDYHDDFSYGGNSHFQLGNDIAYDPDNLTFDLDGDGTPESNHTPIGHFYEYSFSGFFDGCGHTISGIRMNLNIFDSTGAYFINDHLGIFGFLYGAEVTGITLTDTHITAVTEIGGIAGYATNKSTISNCYVKLGVYLTGESYVGGIVGRNTYYAHDDSGSTVTNCHVLEDVHIHADFYNSPRTFGGIAASNSKSTISDCTSAAQFTFGSDVTDLRNFGGIAGINIDDGTVSNCLVLNANIPSAATLRGLGAIVGNNRGTLDHNYYTNCTVAGETTDIGYGYGSGSTWGISDYNDNDGAVPATTVEKTVNGYEGGGGWELIASPMAYVQTPHHVQHLVATPATDYDLYYFDESGGDNGKEWKNYKAHAADFLIENGQGYLYASKDTVNLVFMGRPYAGNGQVTLYKTADAECEGWNLIGNPFATAATIGKPFYVMNPQTHDELIAAETNSVAAMEGIFVEAATDGEIVTFTPQRGRAANDDEEGRIVINVSESGPSTGSGTAAAVIDRAIVRFGGPSMSSGTGQTLPKFQIREGSTKVYIPQDGEDYAIVSVGGTDVARTVSTNEIPVNFKASEDGTYTLTVSTTLNSQLSTLNYLHLIDNMTGADVDLLAAKVPEPVEGPTLNNGVSTGSTTSYTFTAKTTDYASRFKLVFSVSGDADGDNEAPFAFVNNGNIIITADAHGAILQVVDMMGACHLFGRRDESRLYGRNDGGRVCVAARERK